MQPQTMKPIPLPYAVLGVFVLSLVWWGYLAFNTQMDIAYDAVGYQELGRLLQHHGWMAYFKTGPNREPLYPLLVAVSMNLESLTGLVYTKILAGCGVLILLLTQILLYVILRLLKIRQGICIAVLIYMAVSPALDNTAFSLYSEIAAYPLILSIILVSHVSWQGLQERKFGLTLASSGFLGLLFAGAALIKAVFECIAPVYFVAAFAGAVLFRRKERPWLLAVLCLLVMCVCFYVPLIAYKTMNLRYNGNFVVTNRGSWALYGNTARRMEPLTIKRFLTALAYVPGEGVCKGWFGSQACSFWSFRKSDEYGMGKLQELQQQHLSQPQINARLIELSKAKIMHNPAQYILLTVLEGVKMFFWESTQIGFVHYPPWLQRLYGLKPFDKFLRLGMALLSGMAVFFLWGRCIRCKAAPLERAIGLLVFLYILFYSFFFILSRYALPLAPLYFISTGISLQQVLSKLRPNKLDLADSF